MPDGGDDRDVYHTLGLGIPVYLITRTHQRHPTDKTAAVYPVASRLADSGSHNSPSHLEVPLSLAERDLRSTQSEGYAVGGAQFEGECAGGQHPNDQFIVISAVGKELT